MNKKELMGKLTCARPRDYDEALYSDLPLGGSASMKVRNGTNDFYYSLFFHPF